MIEAESAKQRERDFTAIGTVLLRNHSVAVTNYHRTISKTMHDWQSAGNGDNNNHSYSQNLGNKTLERSSRMTFALFL